jgi:single-stranded DNA-binding protein
MSGVFFGTCREGATLKTSKKGHAYVQIPLLVSNGRDQCGYPAQEIVRLVAFEDLAGRLSKTLRKGDEVRAEGTIRFERWNDREGFQRTGLALIAEKVEKIGAGPVKQTKPEEAARPESKAKKISFARGQKPTTGSRRKNISAYMLSAAEPREKPGIVGRDDFSYSYLGPEQCSNVEH